MRLGVFGGTFNPIHFGHLRAAEEARERVRLDRVLFVPAAAPPLKSGESDLAEAGQRFMMAAMAVAANIHFEVSDIELRRADRSYTVETARALRREYPGAELYFILGVDAFMELSLWREPEELVRLMDFVIVGRPTMRFADLARSPYVEAGREELSALDRGEREMVESRLRGGRGMALLGAPLLEISSTDIRARVMAGRSIKYLLPGRVESFIMTHGLYRGDR